MALSNQTWTGLAFTSSARSTTTPASLQCGHRPGIQITGNVFTAAASLSLTQVRRMPVTIKNMIEASEYYLETIYQGIELNWFYCSPRHLCSSTNEPPNAHISSIYLILPALPSLSLLAATTNVKHGDEDNKKSGVIIWDFLRAIIKWAGKSEWVCVSQRWKWWDAATITLAATKKESTIFTSHIYPETYTERDIDGRRIQKWKSTM